MVNPGAVSLPVPPWSWGVLGGVVLLSLAVDLLLHRGDREQGRLWACAWSVVWITLGLLFGLWVDYQFGRSAAEEYLSAYLIEKSLSVDNLFVFLIVFSRLQIPKAEQHRVLQWGIIGAFVTRAVFIAAGTTLLAAWHGMIYPLGAFLIYTGYKTATDHPDETNEGLVLPFVRKHFPFSRHVRGHHFFVREDGRWVATPLFLALIVIEFTDIVFAIDSLPAVFAVSVNPFIVYSSNVFAILGMRALFLTLADLLTDLKYLRYGLAAIMIFAGLKMLGSKLVQLSHLTSLLTVAGILVTAILPSLLAKRLKPQP